MVDNFGNICVGQEIEALEAACYYYYGNTWFIYVTLEYYGD